MIRRLKGKVLIKGRRITDKKEDYYNGPSYDTEDSDDDSVIEDGHSELERDDAPVSYSHFIPSICIPFVLT